MSDLFQNAFRGYLIDHHSPAPPTVTLDKLDAAEYERFFREADITSLMLYMKDHWGYCYYNTEVGTRHPALARDWIAELVPVLRKMGIEYNAYYCIEYDTNTPLQHPEWSIRMPDGSPMVLKGRMARWGMPCTETGYRQHALAQLSEIVRGYRPDSLFLDIFGKTLCFCDACRAKFRSRFGYDLPMEGRVVSETPLVMDFGDAGLDINRFLEDCAQDFLADVLRTVKGIDPELRVTVNFSALYPKRIRDMLDYQFTEPWAGNWLSAAYSRDTAKGQFPQLGPGDVSEVYNYAHDAVYELAAAQIAANGCRVFLYSGSQHVDGTLEHVEAQKVGKAFAGIRRIEPFLRDREVVADVVIIQSESSSHAKSGSEVVVNSIRRACQPDLHRQSLLGAMKLCDRSGVSWKLLPEQDASAEALCRHKVVLLPGVYHVSEMLHGALEQFVSCGGALVADGQTGLSTIDGKQREECALADLFGIRFAHVMDAYASAAWGGYMHVTDERFRTFLPDTTPPLGAGQVAAHPIEAAVLAWIVHPCTPLTDKTWVNWWCPPPMTTDSPWPAITRKGLCVWIASEFFRDSGGAMPLNQCLFNGMVSQLLPDPTVRIVTDTAEAISFVMYRRQDSLVVHVVSHLAEKLGGAPPVIEPGKLLLGNTHVIRSARQVYPVEKDLSVAEAGMYQVIGLPPIAIHAVICLELQAETGKASASILPGGMRGAAQGR